MATFDFKLVLDQAEIDEAEAEADALCGRCKDGTLITAAGVIGKNTTPTLVAP